MDKFMGKKGGVSKCVIVGQIQYTEKCTWGLWKARVRIVSLVTAPRSRDSNNTQNWLLLREVSKKYLRAFPRYAMSV